MASTSGKRLIGLGGALATVNFIGVADGANAPLSALAPLVELWWLLAAVGLGLLAVDRYQNADGWALPGLRPSLGHERQDIIAATDWSRVGRHALRRSYGLGLTGAAAVVMVLALALQEFLLAGIWVVAAILGGLITVLTWRGAYEIFDDHTERITVRAPDHFAAHAFHIALRQQAEDLGYAITTDVSPTEGGTSAAAVDDAFHADGGFKAINRPIERSQTLVPEVDNEAVQRVLTVATLGMALTVTGITLVGADLGGAASTVFGGILVLGGVGTLAYDYAIRTREWAELACVEEGTIYPVVHTAYDDGTVDTPLAVPETLTTEAGAILSVTVSAKCTPLYDEEHLEADFEALVEAVTEAAADCQFETDRGPREVTFDEESAVDSPAN